MTTRPRLLSKLALGTAMVSAALTFAGRADGANSSLQMKAPDGFGDLSGERELLLDVYYAGKLLRQTLVRAHDNRVVFIEPAEVAASIPDLLDSASLTASISQTLPANTALACGLQRSPDCGNLTGGDVGVILDEDRLRLDLFVPTAMLKAPSPLARSYLDKPKNELSLVSLMSATVVGSSDRPAEVYLQNRTVASLGMARFLADIAGGTDTTVVVDQALLVAERQDWRYQVGSYWLPVSDLLGRRRVLAIGASTQLDTRANKSLAAGTPVPLSLAMPGRVDVLVDGRVISSKTYPAGNQLLDSTGLPDGSYDIELRINENGGRVRQERRFFSRGAELAPVGRPLLSGNIGYLDQSDGASLDLRQAFVAASAAFRVRQRVGVDAKVFAISTKVIGEAGIFYDAGFAQVRVSALASSKSDRGFIGQASSSGAGPLSLSVDVRRLKSGSASPVLPFSPRRATFNADGPTGFGLGGTTTQAVGVASYRIGNASLRLLGQYRSEQNGSRSFSVSGLVDVPVQVLGHRPIWLQGELSKSNHDASIRVSARFLRSAGAWSLAGTSGARYTNRKSRGRIDAVGEIQAGHSAQLASDIQLSTDAAVGRDVEAGYARVSSSLWAPGFNVRGDAAQAFGGPLQYSGTFNTGLAWAGKDLGLSGSGLNNAAIQVSAHGQPDQTFDVLVDGTPRGTVRGNETTTVFLEPYRSYAVRLRSKGDALSGGELEEQSVTLYPGGVARLSWATPTIFVVFTRLLDETGRPLANAQVKGLQGEEYTNENGFFQIEASDGERLQVIEATGARCGVLITQASPKDSLWAPEELVCHQKSLQP